MFMVDLGAQSYYSVLGVSPSADVDEIRATRTNMFEELEKKRRVTQDPVERQKLEGRQKEINAAGETLSRPEERAKYDQAHAHLRFFLVRVAAARMFVEKPARMYAVDRAIREFLEEKGI